jgi:hypothetical protein
MNTYLTGAAAAALLLAAPAFAQQLPTRTPSAPQTQLGETTETGPTELQDQANDDMPERVTGSAAQMETAQAIADQKAVPTGDMQAPEMVEAEDGRIITMEQVDAASGAATDSSDSQVAPN